MAAANRGDGPMSGDGNKIPAVSRPQQAPPGPLKCPRCDSPNTKFCYYNNYSQSQPRYLCKACRRYWTKGGALRTVPVGGGCRRRKMMKSSDIGRLGYLNGVSPPMEFRLGGIKIPSYNTSAAALIDQLSGALLAMPPPPPNACFSLDQLPPLCSTYFNFSFPSGNNVAAAHQEPPIIEPVGSVNQDYLQQKMVGVPSASASASDLENKIQNPQPILLEIATQSAPEATFESSSSRIDEATDWLFDDDGVTFPLPATNTFGNGNGNAAVDDDWDDLIQAWATNVNEFTALP